MTLARTTLPNALILAATLALPLSAFAAEDTDLPIRTITLYRSGVGAFERTGTVNGDAVVPLRFQTDQVNDILKSLVVLDRSGRSVGPVTYGSKEPLERRLSSFRINLADNPSMPELFSRLRGEKVTIEGPYGNIEGTILGVETRTTAIPGDRPTVIEEPYVTIVTGGGINAVAVSQIRSFELADGELQAELTRALGMIAEHRADQAKTVDLNFAGAGAHDVYVSYVHEMPVWKTTYRLVLSDKDDTKPVLQGWAIVENTTDSDWRDVRLSLASGRPVAFQMDLYEPLYAYRPMMPIPFAANLAPRLYQSGIDAERMAYGAGANAFSDLDDGTSRRDSLAAKSMGRVAAQEAAPMAPGLRANIADYGQSFDSSASGNEIGEQFFYTLDMPISIDRQQSAMLPVLSSPITGERVSIYSTQTGGTNPMRGVRLTNDSGLALMPGPIAVYDSGAYAGDAQIPSAARNDTQLLAYAADLDVTVNSESKANEVINSLKIVNGLIVKEVTRKNWTTFTIENNDSARDRDIIIETPRFDSGWENVDAKPFETTDTLERYRATVAKGATDKTTITRQRIERSSMAVTSLDHNTVIRYSKNGKMSKGVADAISKAADMQAAINNLDAEVARINKEIDEITADQDRIRRNMGSINSNSELYARYMKTLNDQETRLDTIRLTRETTLDKRTAQQKTLEDYLRGLSVE